MMVLYVIESFLDVVPAMWFSGHHSDFRHNFHMLVAV